METIKNTAHKIVTILLKDFSSHTATSLSKEFKMSRWGIWKILKKLEKDELIILDQIGTGKTSIQRIKLNWDNVLIEKILAFSLTQEALKHKRWRYDFADLEKEVDFLILYGGVIYSQREAKDIDIIGIVSKEKKMVKIGDIVLKIQETQSKKIHSINLTQKEFKQELKKPNKAYLDAVKKGVILFGQENFIKFIKTLQK
ncbi:MAG: hypothetical protein ISS82_01685 [Nanoarchaeota archaeon]|nr:hypothetical protein [Nanoarchaeota archaeon]